MVYQPIYFDTETTGTSIERDRIVEIGAYNPVTKESFSQLIYPEMLNPPESVAVNKITNEMLQGAPPLKDVAPKFITFCSDRAILIAHNCYSFDKPILENEFKRVGVEIPKQWQFLDTLKWARKYRSDLPKHSLQYLRDVYGVKENQAHRALDDVLTLFEVFSKMIDDLPYEKIMELLEVSPKMSVMPFGKYKGTPLKDLSKDYVSWMAKNGILDKSENKELKENLIKLQLLLS